MVSDAGRGAVVSRSKKMAESISVNNFQKTVASENATLRELVMSRFCFTLEVSDLKSMS